MAMRDILYDLDDTDVTSPPNAPQAPQAEAPAGRFYLFVWYGVLADYTDGHAWCIARTLEEALEAIAIECAYCGSENWPEPNVYDLATMTEPFAFTMYGGS